MSGSTNVGSPDSVVVGGTPSASFDVTFTSNGTGGGGQIVHYTC
jgi:hypothetical protein